ncbi:MAG: alpha/beta hydrolase [Bacteroidales bacterium]|nr:alpha/beta hydrolase [Bacteroidales bacterium]
MLFALATQFVFSQKSQTQDAVNVIYDIPFGQADSWDLIGLGVNSPKILQFDLYRPSEMNPEKSYPFVMLINGGSFLGSSNRRPDVISWCDSLAGQGFVAAAINYRKGFNPLISGKNIGPKTGMLRASWRAIQDSRAAIRYFKHHSQSFGIDTTQMFLIGSSSGGIIALHTAFMDGAETIPEAERCGSGRNNSFLGSLDSSSNFHPIYLQHTCDVKGVIALWGGISDLSYIKPDNPTEVLLIHGEKDQIIPVGDGTVFTIGKRMWFMPQIHGSASIHDYLLKIGKAHDYHVYSGKGHAFHSDGRISIRELRRKKFPGKDWPVVYNLGLDFLLKHSQGDNKRF